MNWKLDQLQVLVLSVLGQKKINCGLQVTG